MTLIAEFFQYARARHAIYLRRASGAPGPWTEDPVLQQYRFCNIFRELDTTTVWFRENVRDPLRDQPEVLLATVVFRLFNRITTGEAIFNQRNLLTAEAAFDNFLKEPDTDLLREAILAYCGSGPYTTGSYMTKTPTGLNKLDGMLQVIEWFVTQRHSMPLASGTGELFGWEEVADILGTNRSWSEGSKDSGTIVGLEPVWDWLRRFPFIGDFTAYEIVTDLRHTALLDRAPDINTWANPGPGAKRGLNVMHGRPLKSGVRREVYVEEMMLLLEAAWDAQYWPQYPELAGLLGTPDDWPTWELREVEHTLCEFFKYRRVLETGQGTRQRFRGGM